MDVGRSETAENAESGGDSEEFFHARKRYGKRAGVGNGKIGFFRGC
jgi:hypothetical protein